MKLPKVTPKLTIKKLISIGSIISLGGVALSYNVSNDFRTMVNSITHISQRDTVPPDTVLLTVFEPSMPDTIEVMIIDPSLLPSIEGEINEAFTEVLNDLHSEFRLLIDQVGSVEGAVSELGRKHERLAGKVEKFATKRPMIYIVIDSVMTPIDPDTVNTAESWMRLLFPPNVNDK